VTFLQDFSPRGRKKVQRVSISPDDLRASFLLYITGLLPEPGKTHFEEQLLADQNFSDAAAACEQELIDAYAMHRLDAEETRTIGLWVEASPDRVERVAMARALLQATPHRGLHRRQISFVLAAAACLLVAATLYLVNTKMLHHQQPNTQLSAANTSRQAQTAAATTSITAKPDVVLIAAERTRGEQKTATYQVHRESPVQLQIVLPSEAARSGYQLRVTPLAYPRKTLLRQNDLEAQSMAGQLYLTVTLPPGWLSPATYLASVSHQGDTLTSTFTLKWAPQ
jgi:hypothetical protein